MRLINPSARYVLQEPGLEGVYKQVELAGRTCYRSQDKITEDSAKSFVHRMVRSRHFSVLEHGTVYLKLNDLDVGRYLHDKYSEVSLDASSQHDDEDRGVYCVTTNLRVMVENDWLDDLVYLCEPTEYHAKRITIRFTVSRAIANEFIRHRAFSFAQESTRYCCYSRDKYNKEITCVMPSSFEQMTVGQQQVYERSWAQAESSYMELMELGARPQQARDVLPLSLGTELVMTGLEEDWRHFFDLRYRGTTGAPHPDAMRVAALAHDVILKEQGKDL